MTIVAGFLCQDGWLIAADSQETVSDYSKKPVDKIRLLEINQDWRIGFAAAGHSSYADMLQWRIEKSCARVETLTFDVAERIIAAEILDLHRKHIWPRGNEKPSVEALILIQQKKDIGYVSDSTRMFATSDSALFPIERYHAIGVGAHMADYLYALCCDWLMSAERAELAAIYMLKEIKMSILGCGDNSLVCLFSSDGSFRFTRKSECEQMELAFADLDEVLKEIFAGCCDVSCEKLEPRMSALQTAILGIRNRQIGLLEERAKSLREIRDSNKKAREIPRSAI